MTRQRAVEYAWKLRDIGFATEVMQFSPDRSGWGVAVEGECLKTVHACDLALRAEAKAWLDYRDAVQRGV